MKIVLVSYSQDVNILAPEQSENYIVVGEEESGATTRIPVTMDTVQAIVRFVHELNEMVEGGEPIEEQPEEEEPQEAAEEVPDEEEPEEEPVEQPVVTKKRLVPAESAVRSARQALRPGPQSEAEIPSI